MAQNFYGISFVGKDKLIHDRPRNTRDLASTRLQAILVIADGQVIEHSKIPKKGNDLIADRLELRIRDVKPTSKVVTVFKVDGYNVRDLGCVVGYKGAFYWRPYNKPNERILLDVRNGKLTDFKVSKDGKRLVARRK